MFQFGRIWIAVFIIFMCVGIQPVYALNAPVLSSPLNGTQYSTVQPVTFRWVAVFGATSYLFQLSQNAAMTQIVYQTTTSNSFASFSAFQVGKTYYWRVQAFGSQFPSPYSSVYSLTFAALVDCVVSDWTVWADDSIEACQDNQQVIHQKRTRTVITQPANGGLSCPVLEEFQDISRWCDFDGYTVAVMPLFPFRYNAEGSCRRELPSIVGNSNVIDGPHCYGNDLEWYDNYYLRLVFACSDSHKSYCMNGSWFQCSDGYKYSGGVEVEGYSCVDIQGSDLCPVGKEFYSCQEAAYYGNLQIPDIQASNQRYSQKSFLGWVYYWYESEPGFRSAYKVWGEQACSDDFYLRRNNDDVSASSINQERYQFVSVFHDVESLVENAVTKYVYQDSKYYYRGVVSGAFTWDQVIPEGEDMYGQFVFQIDVQNTNCHWNDWRAVVKPHFWWECSAGKHAGDVCSYCYLGQCETYTCPAVSENYFGLDPYSSDLKAYYDTYSLLELWRYPVDKNFIPNGPIEKISNMLWGAPYISSPGGDPSDVILEKGYKYRFRTELDGFVYSYDFSGWPCMGVEDGQGLGSIVKGVGSNTKGIGVVNTGVGGFEKRTR